MTRNPRPPSPGAPASGPDALPGMVLARSMAPSDNSTSIVIASPAGPQVQAGGFVFSAKEAAPGRRTYVAEAGFAVASAEYRTVRYGATYRDAVADAKSAVRFLREHGDQYGLDTSKVALRGESAGGYGRPGWSTAHP